jgi:STE24 endopeptidase
MHEFPHVRIVFQLSMVVLYPLVIQPLFNKLSPIPEGTLRTRIEALATRLNVPLTNLYVIDGSKRSAHSNAYFYGLPWVCRCISHDTMPMGLIPPSTEQAHRHI